MNVYIRTNFSNKIGLGHLTRSKRLAIEMEKKGINCIFFLDNYCPNNLLNFQKIFLYKNEGKFFSEMKDARTFCEHTKHFEKGYVLIDDYRTPLTPELMLRLRLISNEHDQEAVAAYLNEINPPEKSPYCMVS